MEPDRIKQLIEDFDAELRFRERSPAYRRAVRHYLLPVADYGVNPHGLHAYLSEHLRGRVKESTRHFAFSAVRNFVHWLWEEGEIEEHPRKVLRTHVDRPDSVPVATVATEAVLKMVETAPGPRDAALLAVLADTGIRASEAVGIRFEEIDFDSQQITILGKGGRYRRVPFSDYTDRLLRRYLRKRGRQRGPLWQGTRGGISYMTVYRVVKAAGARVGIDLSPHDLRHNAASHLKVSGAGLDEVAEILGHRSLQTTRRYVAATREVRAQKAHRDFGVFSK